MGQPCLPSRPNSVLRAAPPRDLRIGNAPQGGELRVPPGQPTLGDPEALSRASCGHRCQVKSKGPHQPHQTFGRQPDGTSLWVFLDRQGRLREWGTGCAEARGCPDRCGGHSSVAHLFNKRPRPASGALGTGVW